MRKIIFLLTFVVSCHAYNIGGMFASLIECSYGQYGYEYGYIGTYKGSDNKIYQIFFGRNYCQF